MKLDNKISKDAVILDCFSDMNEVKEKYLNTMGYFAWDLENFIDLEYCTYSELTDVEDCSDPFSSSEMSKDSMGSHLRYRFFLSEEYVNSFPFNFNETIGEVLKSELKDDGLVVTVKPTEKFLNYLKSEKYL